MMAKSKKILIFALLLLLLISVSAFSCSIRKKDSGKKIIEDIRIGSEGVSVSFMPNNPPPIIHVEPNIQNVDVILEITNRGAYPQPEDAKPLSGKLYLSGYDKNILEFEPAFFDLSKKALNGKSLVNPKGESDVAVFKGKIKLENLKVEKYESAFLATMCYHYTTIAGPSVCIDPDPYAGQTSAPQKKVCQIAPITLSSQGAPVAIVRIDEQPFATRTEFLITIKNVGAGEVIRNKPEVTQASQPAAQTAADTDPISKCDPFGTSKLSREDIDKVFVDEVSTGQVNLLCWPFTDKSFKAEQGFVRLTNGEGSIKCELQKTDSGYPGGNTAYTTPLKIVLSYAYKTTAESKTLIKKENVGTN